MLEKLKLITTIIITTTIIIIITVIKLSDGLTSGWSWVKYSTTYVTSRDDVTGGRHDNVTAVEVTLTALGRDAGDGTS